MIEFTTGVVFLMSSLYGAGHADNHIDAITEDVKEVSVVENHTFSDAKAVESYLREQYADTPILVEIARCESRFRQFNEDGTVLHGKANKNDIGVMQINEFYHSEDIKRLGVDIYTLKGNVEYAKYIYSKYGSSAWSASSACWGGDIARK